MATFYHVVPAEYEGGDLLSFDEQEARGWAPVWKWGGDPVDCDVVCLYNSVEEAQEHVEAFQPNGRILRVTIPDDEDMLSITKVSEGYTAVYTAIPARYIEAL